MDILARAEYVEVATEVVPSVHAALSCPRCGYTGLVASQPQWWEAAICAVTERRPFRCFSCRSRRWRHLRDVTRPPVSGDPELP